MPIKIKYLYISQNTDNLNINHMKKKSINSINQKYFLDFIDKNERLKAGRRHYNFYYDRIINNIKLSKLYKKNKSK